MPSYQTPQQQEFLLLALGFCHRYGSAFYFVSLPFSISLEVGLHLLISLSHICLISSTYSYFLPFSSFSSVLLLMIWLLHGFTTSNTASWLFSSPSFWPPSVNFISIVIIHRSQSLQIWVGTIHLWNKIIGFKIAYDLTAFATGGHGCDKELQLKKEPCVT